MSEELVTLESAKFQLRVLHNREDAHIRLLIKAALKHIENFLDKPLVDVCVDGVLPEDLQYAALLIITDMYENRAAQTEVNLYVNQAVESYMLPYRKMGV
ncbi:head-tail connector protein [Acinetobacter lwoffii]|uniref:head-tail connector protein n=1 Tax=Acinetobacter lwoffii TaxID=28090 RepID=UPI002DBD8C70|nr:head-tail connector protein [Acinetobacter lwoffii]MEB6680280.1 head-tail connector protein [Acinetobacter lwoffii]